MRRVASLLALLALLGAAGCSLPADPIAQARGWLEAGRAPVEAGPLKAVGILEARTAVVSNDLGGRITAVLVEEGDSVAAGQLVLTLDDSLLAARQAPVDAAVAEAQAQLDLLRASVRPEQIALAEAQLAQAEAGVAAAQQAWDDARLLRDNLQALDVAIVEAAAAVQKAEHQAAAARALAEAADLEHALWGRVTEQLQQGFDVPLPGGGTVHVDNPAERGRANTQWNLSGQQAWEAWQTAYAAEDAVATARTALADLRRQRSKPILMDVQVNQAEAAYRRAVATVAQARAALEGLQAGVRPEQVAVAQQAIEQARAAQAPLDVQLAKTRVRTSREGLVSKVAVRQGEVAVPGAPLLEIADLGQITLVVYVLQPELGRVWLGQPASVSVDSYPGRVFPGTVTRIADQAEFSPRGLQTEDARANAVFAVEISVANPDGALKPGMPADAQLAVR